MKQYAICLVGGYLIMDYKDFCSELKIGILENAQWGIRESDYSFYPDGFTSENPEEIEFIHNTNLKYNHMESNILMGDYIVLNITDAKSHCRFSATYLFEEFNLDGWDRIWYIIDENIKLIKDSNINEVTQKIVDYSFAQERLIIRPINYSDNRFELRNAVYKKYGDIALVLYAVLYDNQEMGLGTFKIPKIIFDGWDKDLDEIWNTALTNTNVMAPPRIYMNVHECVAPPYTRGAFMAINSTIDHIEKHQVPTLTTTKKTNGAIALFYPGVKEKLAELFGESYYVAFTSINDVRIHHKDTVSPLSVLRRLKDVNSAFPKEEILSRKVYYYDKDKKTFEMMEL